MPSAANDREFSVHARNLDSHHARLVLEQSFEAAAVAYVEDLHTLGDDPEINVIVRDVATNHEHCFLVDIRTGETAPCG